MKRGAFAGTLAAGGLALAALALIAFALGAVPDAHADWIATGQFQYRDRVQDLSGFTGAEPDHPARRVDVQIVDTTTGDVLASGATDANGFYSIPVTDTQVRNVRARMVSLSSMTAGLLIDVRNNQSARLPFMVNGALINVHNPNVNQDFGASTAAPGQGGEAFNIFDVAFDLSDFFAAVNASGWPAIRVTLFWESGSIDGTFFRPSDNSIHLRGGKGYDDTVIGHEYGHFVARNYSRDQSPGGTHFIGDNFQDIRLSWSEGYATFLAGAARQGLATLPSPSYYVDTDGSPGAGNLNFAYEFETPSEPALGAGSEVAVTAALWDVIDGPSTPDDTPGVDDEVLARPIVDFWEVFRNYLPLPAANNVSLEDFWDGWFRPAFNHGFPLEMQSVFGAHEVDYAPDAFEDDGSFATATMTKSIGLRYAKTFYPAGDLDFSRFTTTAGITYVVETTDLLSDANTTLTVYGPDQTTIVGTNADRTGFDPSSRVQFTATQNGTHYVRVEHQPDLGVYGSYSVRVLAGTSSPGTTFTDVGPSEGVANTGNSRGVGWGDVDGDGRLDLFVCNVGGVLALYKNTGAGFLNKAAAWGAAVSGEIEGGAFCDYDKDGDLDLFVTTIGFPVLLQNRRADSGDSVFVNVTAAAGLNRTFSGRSASWGDADRDGFADLFVTDADGEPALFRNQGNGTFADITVLAGVSGGAGSISAAWCDYDRDGDDDLYVVMNGGPSRLYRNQLRETGGLTFTNATSAARVPAGLSGFACDWGDFDNDGWMDLYVADGGGTNALYRNRGDGSFDDVTLARNVACPLMTTTSMWGDYDNDADLDLFVGNLSQTGLPGFNILYESVAGQFTASSQLSAALPTRSAAWGDFDDDGDVDLYVSLANGSPNQLWRNNTSGANGFKVRLLGRTSNRDGYGAVVRARIPGKPMQHRLVSGGSGFGSQNSVAAEFGLGAAAAAESLIVDWPSGKRSVLLGPVAGSHLVDESAAVDVPPPGADAPFTLALEGARPHPLRNAGVVAFTIPGVRGGASIRGSLALYAVNGRRVRTLSDGPFAPGPQQVPFDGRDDGGVRLAPGVYHAELVCDGVRAARKVVLLP
ncbi:MAG: FG-GAP-like repeat-containing protein [Candidatus Eiseniibacteriota bacterium]